MKLINLLIATICIVAISCKSNSVEKTEKHLYKQNNVIDVSDKIIDIKTELLFGKCHMYVVDKYLVVAEVVPSGDRGIHLFDLKTFAYITSGAIVGKGPGEVSRQGRLGIDSKNRIIWVSDHGKRTMWKFPLDSILNNKMYKPTERLDLNNELFIERFGFLNDTIAIGKAVRVLSSNSFEMTTAKLNTKTNAIEVFGYEHPDAVGKKSNSMFHVSLKNGIYVNCYYYCDLMTICDLNGNLKFNVYGDNPINSKDLKYSYFFGVDIIDSTIVASYIGDVMEILDEHQRPMGNLPTKFFVFDVDGNYKATLETGSKFTSFCLDEENKRVIVYFSGRENPLGYFELNVSELE